MKGIGYGQGYRYVHDDPAARSEMPCLPERFQGRDYLSPDDTQSESDRTIIKPKAVRDRSCTTSNVEDRIVAGHSASLICRAHRGGRLARRRLFASLPRPDPTKRPNVLVLFADDQRADTIAALGNSHIRTPNLDRLVSQGTSFTRAYCMGSLQGAVCVPSRAMLLTGRTLFHVKDDLKGQPTWPEAFAKARLHHVFHRQVA